MSNHERLLILYTGGTIGMHKTESGLKPGSLKDLLKELKKRNSLPENVQWEELFADGRPIDSSDANHALYNRLADKIASEHDHYRGFVILFGTDTMGQSAGHLSYMLEGLKKPVIFTGSMLPIRDRRSDGLSNLYDAIAFARHSDVEYSPPSEVLVSFNHNLLHGAAAFKFSANGFNALQPTDGREPIARIDSSERIKIVKQEWDPGFPPDYPLRVCHLPSEGEVSEIQHTIMRPEVLESVLREYSDQKAIVFHGSGILPGSEKYNLIERILPPTVLRCYLHERKRAPAEHWIDLKGIQDVQQAIVKMSYVLSRTDDPREQRELAVRNLRGEFRGPVQHEREILRELADTHERLSESRRMR